MHVLHVAIYVSMYLHVGYIVSLCYCRMVQDPAAANSCARGAKRSSDPVSNTLKAHVLLCHFKYIERDCSFFPPKNREESSRHIEIDMEQSRVVQRAAVFFSKIPFVGKI